MSMLVEDWVSAASAQQRAGRAGRVRPGVCYATYTRQRFEGGGMRRYGAPEITRVPLEELVLQVGGWVGGWIGGLSVHATRGSERGGAMGRRRWGRAIRVAGWDGG